MRFMNEDEIDIVVRQASQRDDLRPYAKYLADWVDIVNRNSDGWAYWRAGCTAGIRLADLLITATAGHEVTKAQWSKAIAGIKSTATRQLKHGNKVPVPTLEEKARARVLYPMRLSILLPPNGEGEYLNGERHNGSLHFRVAFMAESIWRDWGNLEGIDVMTRDGQLVRTLIGDPKK